MSKKCIILRFGYLMNLISVASVAGIGHPCQPEVKAGVWGSWKSLLCFKSMWNSTSVIANVNYLISPPSFGLYLLCLYVYLVFFFFGLLTALLEVGSEHMRSWLYVTGELHQEKQHQTKMSLEFSLMWMYISIYLPLFPLLQWYFLFFSIHTNCDWGTIILKAPWQWKLLLYGNVNYFDYTTNWISFVKFKRGTYCLTKSLPFHIFTCRRL